MLSHSKEVAKLVVRAVAKTQGKVAIQYRWRHGKGFYRPMLRKHGITLLTRKQRPQIQIQKGRK
jgi:hypothetical protein